MLTHNSRVIFDETYSCAIFWNIYEEVTNPVEANSVSFYPFNFIRHYHETPLDVE